MCYRALQVVEQAWRVLADPAARESYDEEIGFRRLGEGLASPSRGPSGPDVSLGEGWSTAVRWRRALRHFRAGGLVSACQFGLPPENGLGQFDA
jgi:hypothetical protein